MPLLSYFPKAVAKHTELSLEGVTHQTSNNVTYTPNAGFTGTDSFTYKATDGNGVSSNIATVNITVGNAPISVPTADSKTVVTTSGTPVQITLTGIDLIQGDVLTFSVVTPPQYGALNNVTSPERELGIPISVAGHKVEYDDDGRLYCDVQIEYGQAYFPFIRLALVRYQPASLVDAHLSHVVLADFSQLMPDRSVSITFDSFDPRLLQVAITGLTYDQPTPPPPQYPPPVSMQVTVEMKVDSTHDVNTWVQLPSLSQMKLDPHVEDTRKTTLWFRSITLPFARNSRQFRLVIEEFEIFDRDETGTIKQKRLVYADTLLLS
jgi:hypothetical protein